MNPAGNCVFDRFFRDVRPLTAGLRPISRLPDV